SFLAACTFEDFKAYKFIASGSKFGNNVSFERFASDGDVMFRPFIKNEELEPTTFQGRACFTDATVAGTLDFTGAQFHDAVRFDRLKTQCLICSPSDTEDVEQFAGHTGATTFHGIANFHSLNVTGLADFRGVDFRNDAYFDFAKFGQTLNFDSIAGTRQVY